MTSKYADLFSDYTNEQILAKTRIRVIKEEDRESYKVYYCCISPLTGRRVIKVLTFNPSNLPSQALAKQIAENVITRYKTADLCGKNVKDPHSIKPRTLRAEMIQAWNRARLCKTGVARLEADYENHIEEVDAKSEHYVKPNSLLRSAGDTGKTIALLGRSKSGKTTLLVDLLNKVIDLKRGGPDPRTANRPMYDKIILMTGSPNAEPLKSLRSPEKVLQMNTYVPSIIRAAKMINDKDCAKNGFNFLFIFDDLFAFLSNKNFRDLILTLRNSNITTVVLTQYHKHLKPETRNNVNEIYITRFIPEEWLYILDQSLCSKVSKMMGLPEETRSSKLSHQMDKYLEDDIFFYDQINDDVKLVKRCMKK